jgi:hypothetical protein
MARQTRIAAALLASILLSSCAISRALYVGEDIYSARTGPRAADALYDAENINGIFPEAVYIKTRTQTFNAYHYYILNDGLIWYKSIGNGKGPSGWTLFTDTGLPHDPRKTGFNNPKRIAEISADADELVALSDEGGFYRYCFDRTIAHKSNEWLDRQGWPNEEQMFLDRRTAGNLSWALGKRNAHVLYYEDRFGNQHHNGTMEIATTYVLLEDGQEICYADPGLPGDFSRNYIGPERGAFKAVTLSASASTMFVINEKGEMYTRLADFDTTGCDPLWFKYTYIPYESNLPGTDYFSNLNEWGLPAEGWRYQPRIPLAGKAAITRHITILQNGRGNSARELRVAGLNESGATGYWSKAIFDDAWGFEPVPLYFNEDAVLKNSGPADGDPLSGRGPSLDKYYSGYYWNGGEMESGWEYAIPNFNILEGDCDFLISRRGETCTLKLHPVEMWTYLKRDYLPGRTGSTKIFLVTLEIPDNAFSGLSAVFAAQLVQKYAKQDKKLFQYVMAASRRYIILRDNDNTGASFFLIDGTMSDRYSEFRQIRLVEDFEEIERYGSPELSIGRDRHAGVTYGELTGKIELNRAFRDKLKYQIRSLNWARFTAFEFNFGYIPAHYLALITPLRFIDMPKIRTITGFGSRIISANSSYVYAVSNIRIWAYKKIIELLEARLRYYSDLAKELSETASNAPGASGTAEISPPFRHGRYSENISGYWDIAGLPRVIPGTFFGPGSGQRRAQKPAVLRFIRPGTEPELFGWYLSIGEPSFPADEGQGFSIFIDPLKSAGRIYSRKGKTPKERKVHLHCILYTNPEADRPFEREIINNMLMPFAERNGRGINVRISFDGSRFEIRQYSAQHGNSLIFRGEL